MSKENIKKADGSSENIEHAYHIDCKNADLPVDISEVERSSDSEYYALYVLDEVAHKEAEKGNIQLKEE